MSMNPFVLASAAALLTTTACPQLFAQSTCTNYGEAKVIGHLYDLNESSGIAPSHINPGLLWTHNDSGDGPRVYGLLGDGTLAITVDIVGASAIDWEDMDLGPCGGCACLFMGDIGDNNLVREGGTVYRVVEPQVDERVLGASASVQLDRALGFVYPDGPHNAETLLVDPRSGVPYIVTKAQEGRVAVYRFPEADPANLPATLVKVADLDFLRDGPLGRPTTGGAFSADGSRMIVRTYKSGWQWQVGSGSVETALQSEPMKVELPRRKQGEAIAFTPDGSALVMTTEGEDGRLDLVPCTSGSPQVTPAQALTTACANSASLP